jgi:hypothetical protein
VMKLKLIETTFLSKKFLLNNSRDVSAYLWLVFLYLWITFLVNLLA